jgi:hypothetical protein
MPPGIEAVAANGPMIVQGKGFPSIPASVFALMKEDARY